MNNNEEVVATFSRPSSRTPNWQCQIMLRKGKDSTRNVYIDTLHGNTSHILKGIYFRPNEMIELLQALQRANEMV